MSLLRYVIAGIPSSHSEKKLRELYTSINPPLTLPRAGFHLTLFGFYSRVSEEKITTAFSKSKNMVLSQKMRVEGIDCFDGSHLVLLVNKSAAVMQAHGTILNLFTPFVAYKDGKTFHSHPEKFKEHYTYIGTKYNPHISIGKYLTTPSPHVLQQIAPPSVVVIDSIALYKKIDDERIILASKKISDKS